MPARRVPIKHLRLDMAGAAAFFLGGCPELAVGAAVSVCMCVQVVSLDVIGVAARLQSLSQCRVLGRVCFVTVRVFARRLSFSFIVRRFSFFVFRFSFVVCHLSSDRRCL